PPGTAPRSLFLFSAQNSANAIAAVQTLVSLASHSEESPPAPDDFEGHGIYSIPLGGGAAGGNFLYCAAGGGYVALTADRTMLEQYLRGAAHPADSLAATRALLQAAQRVGGARHGFFAYENERDTMRSTFETLKRSGAAMRTSPPGFHSRFAALSQWADFSLLPDYDAVAKYFYFVVYAGDSTAEGLSFKTFAPDPPALRLN
ncbi:MAG: hypothetical protein KGR98_12260, partial [Verrucomicrobia bacterium]|nr:hypothetical protein [Verrucomicrobiota bacterium]